MITMTVKIKATITSNNDNKNSNNEEEEEDADDDCFFLAFVVYTIKAAREMNDVVFSSSCMQP